MYGERSIASTILVSPKNLAAKKMSQRKTVQSFQSRENG